MYRDDNYTNLMQPNFANPIDTINSTYGLGFDVTGYGTRKNLNLSRPFGGPENIVLLYDGSCGSTCALFSQSMKWDAGVKSIAMGGRPEVRGKIQGVGGVKGSQMYSFGSVYGFTQMAKRATNDSGLIAQLDRFTPYIMSRASATGVNVKDQILRQDWNDGTPAQFVAEYSDCRLYWRADMHRDITNLWKAAATAAFKGGECAYGAIDYTNTTAPSSKRRVDARPAPLFQSRSPLSPSWGLLREPMVEWDLKSWIFEANHYMATED